MPDSVVITGVSVMSGLGVTPAEHQQAMDAGRHGLRPLRELTNMGEAFSELPSGWIRPRSLLAGNRYGPASNFALRLAEAAITDAGWTEQELCDCWLYVGTSRGNAAGSLAPWPGHRGHGQMSTSNSMHSEMAAAVSIAYGIHGPYQVISNGCASGLDAIGFGYWAVTSGMAPRALIISADLPLIQPLLHSYHQTGLLSRTGANDPYSKQTTGFLPAEGGAALTLEPSNTLRPKYADIRGYWANSDAYHPLGLPADGAGIAECLQQAAAPFGLEAIQAICPHASGTFAHGQAEQRALRTVFSTAPKSVSIHLMKPFTGHAIGASGAIDTAVLAHYLRQRLLPPNLPGLTDPGEPFTMPETASRFEGGVLLKISIGMGGHNAIIALS